MNKLTFGEKVRKHRKLQSYTLELLAAAANTTKSYLSTIENGGSIKPSASIVYNLADSLDVTVEYLLGKRDLNRGAVQFNSTWNKLDLRGKLVTKAVMNSLLTNQAEVINCSAND